MDISSDILAAYEEAKSLSSATMSYNCGTPVTCSVYRSYGTNIRYETDSHGYRKHFEDLSIIMKATDVTGSIEPLKTMMVVSGIQYMVGSLTTTYPDVLWITLRK